MAEYLSPGVYVEEVKTGPRPIEGVSTSTAGFAGVTERGPAQPRMVTSWSDYQRWYGGYLDPGKSYLPFGIQGFFENGGQRAFVARVTGQKAVAASLEIPAQAGSGGTTVLRVEAIGKGAWGNGLVIRVLTASLADPASPSTSGLFRIQIIYYAGYVDGAPQPFVDPFIDPLDSLNLSNPKRKEPDAVEDYDNLSADPLSPDYVLTTINGRSHLVVMSYRNTVAKQDPVPVRPENSDPSSLTMPTAPNGLNLVFTARGQGVWADAISIKFDVAGASHKLSIQSPTGNETFEVLANTVLPMINGSSRAVRVRWGTQPSDTKPPELPAASVAAANLKKGKNVFLKDGADSDPVTAQDYIGNSALPVNKRTGLAGLEVIDEISLLCVPDEVRTGFAGQVTNALVDQCERLRYRFVVLSTDEQSERAGDPAKVEPPRDSSYGAVYFPWVRVIDPRTQRDFTVPAAGHMTGIYARVDVERGVHKAPANEVVRAIVTRDLGADRKPLDYIINKQEHDILNPKGVDVIRDFRERGRGIRVWGARTMSTDTQWKYVNVRRLFIFVEASIDRGTQWVVFEPNDETTWSAVRRSLTGFLTSVWRSGGLMGTTVDEAFFVKCDRTTMTQDDIDNGRLICLVGIAPVKPAEFVIFRISQKTADAQA